jgi:hypothetical protein
MSVQAQSQPEVDEYSRRVGASEGRVRVTANQKASQQCHAAHVAIATVFDVHLTLGTPARRDGVRHF